MDHQAVLYHSLLEMSSVPFKMPLPVKVRGFAATLCPTTPGSFRGGTRLLVLYPHTHFISAALRLYHTRRSIKAMHYMNYASLEERRFFLGLGFLKVVIQKAMSYLCIVDTGEWL